MRSSAWDGDARRVQRLHRVLRQVCFMKTIRDLTDQYNGYGLA